MTVLRIPQLYSFTYNTVSQFYVYIMAAILRTTQCGSFTCNAGWQVSAYLSVAVLHMVQSSSFTCNTGVSFLIRDVCSFTYYKVW